MSRQFDDFKRLYLAMNAVNTNLPEETRQRCKNMLKESEMSDKPICAICGRPAEYELKDYLSVWGYWCGEKDCAEIVENYAKALVNYADEQADDEGRTL